MNRALFGLLAYCHGVVSYSYGRTKPERWAGPNIGKERMAMRSTAEAGREWRIWQAVPEGYNGVWRSVDARGWTYYGGFTNGRLVCGVGLDADTDEDTKAAWLAMLELTTSCHEPKVVPMLPPPRVLPFPARLSLGA